jgi:adenylate kinase
MMIILKVIHIWRIVIVVGDAGTGKTNIIQTYDKGTIIIHTGIRPNHTVPTVGI